MTDLTPLPNSNQDTIPIADGHSKSRLTAALRREHVEIPALAPSQHRIGKPTIGG